MRQIKFRAWYKTYKVMLPVLSLKFQENKDVSGSDEKYTHPIISCPRYQWGSVSMPGPAMAASEDLILMQFTGLLDKNGVGIYEGDILKEKENLQRIGQVVYEPSIASFMILVEGGYCHLNLGDWSRGTQLQWTEIIGNIFENPELLEEPKS